LDGIWILGNNYRTASKLYGAFPPRFLDRVMALFPEIGARSRVLHLFSGSLPPGPYVRVDVRKPMTPDLAGNAEALPFRDGSFDLVVADPPYSKQDAEKYDGHMPNRRKVLAEVARVVRKGGNLVWLDTMLPMFAKRNWNWWGAIGVVRSSNHRVRLVSCFERSCMV
jgi:SAM-dependent methyltransferase